VCDPNLSNAPAPPCVSDLTADGTTDTRDLALLLLSFGRTVSAFSSGDCTGDGRVDTQDLTLLVSNLGHTCPPLPPMAPSHVRSESIASRWVDISWHDNSTNEGSFEVLRSTDGVTFSVVASVPANTTTLRVTNLHPSTSYQVTVRAANAGGASRTAAALTVSTNDEPPAAPVGLVVVSVSSRSIDLSWNDMADNEDSYYVEEYDPNYGWSTVDILPANSTSARDTVVMPDLQYTYRIRARNSVGYSAPSNVVVVRTADEPPAAPSGLTVASLWSNALDLAWIDNSSNETEFRVALSTDGVNFDNRTTVGANVHTVRINDLRPESTYWFKVRAGNAAGYSGYTQAVVATTTTLPAPPSLTATRDESTPALDVVLSWTPVNPQLIDGYRVARSTDNTHWDNVGVTTATISSFRDATGLVAGQRYYYKVRAFKAYPDRTYYSGYSNTDDAIVR